MLAMFLLLVLLLVVTVSANRYHHNHNNEQVYKDFAFFNQTMVTALANATHQHGLITCGYKKVLPNIMTVIAYLRIGMKSRMRLAIAHCDELDDFDMKEIRSLDSSVEFVNVCANNGLFAHMHHILRSYFCKVAALIMSPFPTTILFDLDVIWLRKPEELLATESFRQKGAFYFRDRTGLFNDKPSVDSWYSRFKTLFGKFGVEIDGQAALQLSRENGIGVFWYAYSQYLLQNRTDGNYAAIYSIAETSIVALDKSRHIRMLYILRAIILDKDFDRHMFYGNDKELFWIAHTIADDEYTWSPFMPGQYGDCYGVLLHFHPDDKDEVDMKKVRPYHINGEYVVEENVYLAGGLIAVGDFIRHVQSVPKLVTSNDMVIGDYNTWKEHSTIYSVGCSYTDTSYCQSMPVKPDLVNVYVLLYQWLLLSRKQSRSGPKHDCIPLNYHFFDDISYMFQKFDLWKYCSVVGCPNPHIPFTLNRALPWSKEDEQYGYYCEPVYYSNVTDIQGFINITLDARQPFNRYVLPFDIEQSNGLVVQCISHHTQWNFCKDFRTIYRIWDKQYHAFPNFATFVSMNYTIEQVIKLDDYVFYTIPVGQELPSV